MPQPIGIYIHVPFCRSKCPYCDFYSLRVGDEAMDAYTAALLRHIATAPTEKADSVYLGGGTPTLLGPRRLSRILEAVAAHFPLSKDCEITAEANPRAAEGDTIAALGRLGFTRVSFGMQSAVSSELRLLGRRHTREEVAQSVELARQGGIDNISLDVMLGVIGQTAPSLSQTLDFAASLKPTHISAYILKVEEGTVYNSPRFLSQIPDEDTQVDLYLAAVEGLSSLGFHQYEISNFAKPGYESRHNLKYWRCQEYLGFGPAAHSYYGGRRFALPRDLESFCKAPGFGDIPFDGVCDGGGFFEEFMLGLRLAEGINLDQLGSRFSVDVSPLERACPPLERRGLLCLNGHHLSLTTEGFLLSNSIISHLLNTISC